MERTELTKALLSARKAKDLKWEDLGNRLGCSPVWIASVVLGQNSMNNPELANKLCDELGITAAAKDVFVKELMTPPIKMQKNLEMLKQDPCIYRLHEAMLIYGESLKELINEKFGAGIMSAIDIKVDLEKEEDPKGDRVKIILSGKYLGYREW